MQQHVQVEAHMADHEFQLDELPDDVLKAVFQQLSTYARRNLCLVSRKWQRLVAQSWDDITISLHGASYHNVARSQLDWLLLQQLQNLQQLSLALKGVHLSGTDGHHLLKPLLDVLQQEGLPKLHTLRLQSLAAGTSLPGPLCHSRLKSLYLDIFALTDAIQCPQLLELTLCTVSMPGPSFFSETALQPLTQLKKLQLWFKQCNSDHRSACFSASWIITLGLSHLHALQYAKMVLPRSSTSIADIFELPVDIYVWQLPVFPPELSHLELHCQGLDLAGQTVLTALKKLPNLFVLFENLTDVESASQELSDLGRQGYIMVGDGPFGSEFDSI